MTAPDHTLTPLENALREWGHPYMTRFFMVPRSGFGQGIGLLLSSFCAHRSSMKTPAITLLSHAVMKWKQRAAAAEKCA
ncbi:MAG: hypothetical protein ABSA13_18945 [Beijerinckiaceae bacterium]|jgi:hypothetical protein